MADYKDPDEFFDARLAPALEALKPAIAQIVHDQVLAVLRDEAYREIVRRVWDEKIGDSRGSWAARAVAADMSWRVKALLDGTTKPATDDPAKAV